MPADRGVRISPTARHRRSNRPPTKPTEGGRTDGSVVYRKRGLKAGGVFWGEDVVGNGCFGWWCLAREWLSA
jgi:hypothetical protein